MATYVLAAQWPGGRQNLPLTPAEHRGARQAIDLLLAGLGLEEAYDVLLLNYQSFETAVFAATLTTVLDRRRERHEVDEVVRDLDRHLVNVLASGEMFMGHGDAFLKSSSRRATGLRSRPS